MKERIIRYYTKDLGVWQMVYSNMNIFGRVVYIVLFIVLIGVISFCLLTGEIWISLIPILCLFIWMVVLNEHNKKIIRRVYGTKENSLLWGSKEFQDKRALLLKCFVTKNVKEIDLLQEIIVNLKQQMEYKKNEKFIIPGLFLALFVPLWNQLLVFIFKDADIVNVMVRFIGILLIISLLVITVSLIRLTIKDLFDRETTKISNLVRMLDDIKIEWLSSRKRKDVV